MTIQIKGQKAWFSDGVGPVSFEESDGSLVLRGARLVGTTSAPVWQFPNGVQRHWARPKVTGAGNTAWARTLFSYKAARQELRHRLNAAYASHDFEQIMSLKLEWTENQNVPSGLTRDQEVALSAGRELVAGVCFRHKKFDYRGVIMGHDPWCTYPPAWRALWVPNRPHGEQQTFYHCVVDERDRPGKQSRYVAEENIELCQFVFPLQGELVDRLLICCDQLGGYLPGPQLEKTLQQRWQSFVV